MKRIEIYTDGACRGNPGPGGWGALLKFDNLEKEISGGEDNTTNNRMELLAAIKAIESVTREGFKTAHEISSFSFAAMAREAKSMLNNDASLMTMTYLGSVRSVPNYNVMGPAKASLESTVRFMAADLGPESIRVNGISAGPIKTLAASGVSGFRSMLKHVESKTSLRRNVTIEDVGNTAAFLGSDLSAGMTGEILYVDAGYRNLGMNFDME